MLLGLQFQFRLLFSKAKVSRSFTRVSFSFTLFMYKICVYCLLKARLGISEVLLCIHVVFGFF